MHCEWLRLFGCPSNDFGGWQYICLLALSNSLNTSSVHSNFPGSQRDLYLQSLCTPSSLSLAYLVIFFDQFWDSWISSHKARHVSLWCGTGSQKASSAGNAQFFLSQFCGGNLSLRNCKFRSNWIQQKSLGRGFWNGSWAWNLDCRKWCNSLQGGKINHTICTLLSWSFESLQKFKLASQHPCILFSRHYRCLRVFLPKSRFAHEICFQTFSVMFVPIAKHAKN